MKEKRRDFLKKISAGIFTAAAANVVKPERVFSAEKKSNPVKVGIEWSGHGSFCFHSPKGKVILLDPWISTNPGCPAPYRRLDKPDKVDILLFAHGHVDHFVLPDTKEIVNKFNPKHETF